LIYTTVPLLLDDEIRPWSAVQLLIVASLGVLVSATSVFVSVPAVNAVAIRALMRRDQSSSALLLLPAILFDGAFLLGAVWFRFAHYGGIHAGYDVSRDLFQRLLHPNRLYRFVKHRMLEDIARGLPSWIETDVWNPAAVEWSLIFAVIGLVWLLLRRSTRAIGVFLLVVLIGFAVAAYTDLYPLTTARRSIFCYPVTITLAAMSPEALTAWWSRRSIVQLVVGVMVAAFAVYAPVRVTYWDVDDARLVTRLTTVLTPSDDLILSPASAYLTAYYGRWRATVPKEHLIEGRAVSIIRDGTLQLPTNKGARVAALQAFLQSPLPDRICYVAFRTGPDETNDVLSALNDHGYATEVLETTTLGKLYLGHR
jgi:hypothetical protein